MKAEILLINKEKKERYFFSNIQEEGFRNKNIKNLKMTTIKFDLIKSLTKHLDPHLSIVLLEHYEAQDHKVFHPEVLQREKLLVLIRTKIIDYIQQEYDKINDPVTQKIKSGDKYISFAESNIFCRIRKNQGED